MFFVNGAHSEIKHSRIAMLATLGFVATEFVKLPGAVHDVSPIAAHDAAVASGSGFQVLATIAALEFIGVVALKQTLDGGDRQPGEFGFDPLNLWGKTQKDKDVMAEKEIANGRTAMLAFAGVPSLSFVHSDLIVTISFVVQESSHKPSSTTKDSPTHEHTLIRTT